MLLETVFTLYMSGLMTTVGTDTEKTHLAFLDDREHLPVIVISEKTTSRVIPLRKGDSIRFENLDPGPAKTTPSFDKYVVDLSNVLVGGGIDDEVKYRWDHPGVLAYLEYPAGTLSVTANHDKKAKIVSTGNNVISERCVAKTSRLQSTTKASSIVLVISNHLNAPPMRVPFAPDAQVLLANASVNHASPHFSKYRRLAAKSAREIHSIQDSQLNCTEVPTPTRTTGPATNAIPASFTYFIDNHPECTVTDYP